jgi:ParB family chromosome partitioning protein
MGAVGREMTKGFAARVEELEKERREGFVILSLDPKRIRASAQANRHALSLRSSDADFTALKLSLSRDGQIMPISVRSLAGDDQFDYEIVSGHRRHSAGLVLDAERPEGFKLHAVLDTQAKDQRKLALHMYLENAARKDLSAYEVARMFQSWLSAQIFVTQAELAQNVNLSEGAVSRYLALATLPDPIIAAFGDPRAIALNWVAELVKALKSKHEAVIEAATRIAATPTRPAPERVLKTLLDAAAAGPRKHSPTKSETVKLQGKKLFSVSAREDACNFKFGKLVAAPLQRELREELKDFASTWLAKRMKQS